MFLLDTEQTASLGLAFLRADNTMNVGESSTKPRAFVSYRRHFFTPTFSSMIEYI
jgi:hypothetical protein